MLADHTVGPPWTCAFHGKGIIGVNQRIGNVPIGPAETDDSDAISVNQPSAIQKINGTVAHRHGCRNFLGRAYEMNIHVGVPDLQNEESFARQRLGDKAGWPRTIDPRP